MGFLHHVWPRHPVFHFRAQISPVHTDGQTRCCGTTIASLLIIDNINHAGKSKKTVFHSHFSKLKKVPTFSTAAHWEENDSSTSETQMWLHPLILFPVCKLKEIGMWSLQSLRRLHAISHVSWRSLNLFEIWISPLRRETLQICLFFFTANSNGGIETYLPVSNGSLHIL